jgi:hypothetical protein
MPDKITIALLGVLCAVSSVQAGKLYSWKDESGQLQYGDSPPPGSRYREQHFRTGTGQGDITGHKGLRRSELDLLRQSDQRESTLLKSRRRASGKYASGKQRCLQMTANYHDALGEPGEDNRKKVKDAYKRMKSACR